MPTNEETLYIRGHPDYLLACKLDYSLGLLEFYEREITKEEFETMGEGYTGNAKSFVSPGNVVLGCTECSITKVMFFFWLIFRDCQAVQKIFIIVY